MAAAAAALLALSALAVAPSSVSAADPTSYLDVHLVTSFLSTGSLESGYLFRVPASESNFAGSPPKGPKWATGSALTGGAGSEQDNLKAFSSNQHGSYPAHRLMLPPDRDAYLCNEADGTADYQNPAGNAASGVFDPDTLLSGFEGGYILVPRGGCTFEAKARSAQRLGASGVIVRNTLDSRYGLVNETADTVDTDGPDWSNTRWPKEQRDYECGTHPAVSPSHPDTHRFGWRAEVEASQFDFSPPPYDGSINNQLLTGTAVQGNLCAKQAQVSSFEKHCPTQRCLLTGRNATAGDKLELKLEACCAWDEYIRMSTDGDDEDHVTEDEEEKITIPALFVTMEKGEDLYDLIVDAEKNSGGGESVQFVNVVPYARWYPHVHFSSILLWALAIFTLWISSFESAKEYRTSWKKISTAVSDGTLVFQRSATNSNATGRERVETEDTVDENFEMELNHEVEMTQQNGDDAPVPLRGGGGNSDDGAPESPFTIEDDEDEAVDFADSNEDEFVGSPAAAAHSNGASNSVSAVLDRVNGDSTSFAPAPAPPAETEPQRVNLQSRSTTAAARQVEINAFHAVFFIVMASAFLFILFFFNLYKVVRVLYGLGGSVAMTEIIFKPMYAKFSSSVLGAGTAKKLQSNAFSIRGTTFKWIDILASASGWAFGIAWIVVGLTWVQPMNNAYYWIVQDIMGVSFCILILGLIHINTIMVATILLLLVFVYDIFYVLISPYFFGTSVMVDVATGGAFRTDPTYCDKYPSDSACRGSLAPLPMLLAIPWFNDFRGGFSMIGLGDILLPGLLISFAARYDAARALVRKCSQTGSIRSGENDESARSHYHLGRIYKALFQGYFGPLMIAYGIGLMVAYIVVWATKKGQPALLYLVPACLGTTFFLGWRRRELSELWSGPKALMKANRMVTVAGRIPSVRAQPTTPANVAEAEVV